MPTAPRRRCPRSGPRCWSASRRRARPAAIPRSRTRSSAAPPCRRRRAPPPGPGAPGPTPDPRRSPATGHRDPRAAPPGWRSRAPGARPASPGSPPRGPPCGAGGRRCRRRTGTSPGRDASPLLGCGFEVRKASCHRRDLSSRGGRGGVAVRERRRGARAGAVTSGRRAQWSHRVPGGPDGTHDHPAHRHPGHQGRRVRVHPGPDRGARPRDPRARRRRGRAAVDPGHRRGARCDGGRRRPGRAACGQRPRGGPGRHVPRGPRRRTGAAGGGPHRRRHRPRRLRRYRDRDERDAGASRRPAQGDGLHHGLGRRLGLRRREGHHDDVLRRRRRRAQPALAQDPRQRRGRGVRHGGAGDPARRGPPDHRRHHVRRHDALRHAGPGTPGGRGVRGPRVPRRRQWRPGDGVADRRRVRRGRRGRHHHRVVRRADRRRSVRGPGPAGCRRPGRYPPGGVGGCPGHVQLRGDRHGAGAVPRPEPVPAQPAGHPDADDARGVRGAGPRSSPRSSTRRPGRSRSSCRCGACP